jgi:hypothetical protein
MQLLARKPAELLQRFGGFEGEQKLAQLDMQLVRFRDKGLRQLHEDGNARGVPSAMADIPS